MALPPDGIAIAAAFEWLTMPDEAVPSAVA